MRARALLLLCLCACGKVPENETERVVAETAATRSASAPAVRAECPATGQWAECSVFERLDPEGRFSNAHLERLGVREAR